MLVIEEAKFPPPTPANMEMISKVSNETPGLRKIAIRIVGISSSRAETIVQFRPPNLPDREGVRDAGPRPRPGSAAR